MMASLSRLNSINAIVVTRCHKCSCLPMSQCSNVPMSQCPNVQMFQCSYVRMFKCLNIQMLKCQMSNIKCQMPIRLNFCRSVPPEFLRSFFSVISLIAKFGLSFGYSFAVALKNFNLFGPITICENHSYPNAHNAR